MVDFRQLRYVVTLAEELHFGRASAREHIVQSALSQQIQRLERSLGVALFGRNTHCVRLTMAGETYVAEARKILSHVERASAAARAATTTNPMIRMGVGDPSFDSMPQVLRAVRHNHPQIEIHQVEASVPEQYRLLAGGRLDIGIGRASHAPRAVASELVRLDPVEVLFEGGHRLRSCRRYQWPCWQTSPCYSAKRKERQSTISSSPNCAARLGLRQRRTAAQFRASAPPVNWFKSGAVCSASRGPAGWLRKESSGCRWSTRRPTTRGHCSGGQARRPSSYRLCSDAAGRCPPGWAGLQPWAPATRRGSPVSERGNHIQ